jgi:hypothetical protein
MAVRGQTGAPLALGSRVLLSNLGTLPSLLLTLGGLPANHLLAALGILAVTLIATHRLVDATTSFAQANARPQAVGASERRVGCGIVEMSQTRCCCVSLIRRYQDAIYLSDGRQILALNPVTGQPSGNIELPEGLEANWADLRVDGEYLVGSSGAHIVCLNRHNHELLWQFEAARTALSLAVGGDRVFVGEIADPRRGEDETRDGRLLALDIATGERLWQREGGARLRYSPSLDIVVTPVGFFRGSDGELVTRLTDGPDGRLVVTRWGRAQERQPGFVAGPRLITLQEEGFRDISPMLVTEIPTGKTVGEPLQWPRRGCTNVRASTNMVTTRYRSNSAWIDLDSCEITPFLGIRPGSPSVIVIACEPDFSANWHVRFGRPFQDHRESMFFWRWCLELKCNRCRCV